MIEFLDWIARAGGAIALLITLLAFLFKEKWKQILQRSLSADLERLKSALTKSQAEHAASLAPQLEQIKHDFQQKLEAYKVSLIAQAEAVKASSELKKSIALRYAEIEFERLVSLELLIAPIASEVMAFARLDAEHKAADDHMQLLQKFAAITKATDQAEMFISFEDRKELLEFRQKLLTAAQNWVGSGKPSPSSQDPDVADLIALAASSHRKLKNRIMSLGQLQ